MFDPANDRDRLDVRILTRGYLQLFSGPEVLEEAVAWLRAHDYRIVELDAGTWATRADLHRAIATTLALPDYYGANLDALDECLRDLAASLDAGLALVVWHYDAFARSDSEAAQVLLDIVADSARHALVFGHPMIGLLQTDDPDLRLAVGAGAVSWNQAEWLHARRHPTPPEDGEHSDRPERR